MERKPYALMDVEDEFPATLLKCPASLIVDDRMRTSVRSRGVRAASSATHSDEGVKPQTPQDLRVALRCKAS